MAEAQVFNKICWEPGQGSAKKYHTTPAEIWLDQMFHLDLAAQIATTKRTGGQHLPQCDVYTKYTHWGSI